MAYVVPQVKVQQEFTTTPAAILNPQRAFVIGPNFFLTKYADGEGLLGQYDPSSDEAFSWPNRPAGAVVDQSFTQVNVKDALLRYYSNTSGDAADEILNLSSHKNRVRAEAVNFKANGDSYPLAAALNGRDVQIGDVARVYANVGGTLYEKWTRVTGLVTDYATPTVAGTGTADPGNETDTLVAGGTGTDDPGNTGSRSVVGVAVSGYDGLEDGYASETYTIEITTASSGGVGALAAVTSASGTDDASDVAISSTGQEIGSRGATFDWNGSGEWEVGDTFTLEVRQAYAPPTAVGGGTFDSDSNTTYIIEVTKGGVSGTAEISISTINGLDVSGPHVVTEDVAVSIGTKGATITFTVTGTLRLIKNEKWYLACTGRTAEGYKTLVLADDLPDPLLYAAPPESSSSEAQVDLNLQLFVRRDIVLPRENFPSAPDVNWSQSGTQITLKAGAQVYQSDFVDTDGDSVALALDADSDGLYSKVYVTYRALLQTYASDISSISDISEVESVLGEVSVDNPLALGVWYALRNSNGTEVKYMAVPTNDLAGYLECLDKATGRRDLYTIVPMTRDADVQSAIAAHVDAMSTADRGQWRIAFFNSDSSALTALIDVDETYPVGGDSEYAEDDLLATVVDDPDSVGTQYTLVTWDATAYPAGGGFVDMGVRAGDVFRTNYRGDGYGNTTYEDYVVDTVISNQSLRLVSGPPQAISVARKFSLQRSLTRNEEAIAFGEKSAAFGSRRVFHVWPDVIEDASGEQIPGFYACAAIAGLISGVVPQQGLTNVAVEGFSDVTRTTDYMSESQLNEMAQRGTWIITRDPDSGQIFTRHQVSTDMTDVNTRELSVTKNVDAISYTFLNNLKPFVGRANVTPRLLVQLQRTVYGTVDFLKAQGVTPTLGGMLVSAEITELRQDTINLDQVVIVLNIAIPYPANVIELKLVI